MGLVNLRPKKLLMRARVFGALLALLPGLAYAEVRVTLRGARLDLKAARAPLSEILGQLAGQTGMRVVSDGPIPSMVLSVSLEDRLPVEVILGVLDGLSLNYAVAMDSTGTRVETLIISGGDARRPDPPRTTSSRAGSYRVESPTQPALPTRPPESIVVDEEPEEPEEPEPANYEEPEEPEPANYEEPEEPEPANYGAAGAALGTAPGAEAAETETAAEETAPSFRVGPAPHPSTFTDPRKFKFPKQVAPTSPR